MFKPRPKTKISVKVKGFFMKPIQYEVRVLDGNWKPYEVGYEPQRYGEWDTDDCWITSTTNWAFGNQMKWLWVNNMFSPEAKNFFLTNNYCDQNGNFALSERFHAILCGNRDNGGTAEEAWQSFQQRGHIPRSLLFYTVEYSGRYSTQQAFDNDYFNPAFVTPQMLSLGQQFLKYVNITYQRIGTQFITPDIQILRAALKQAPLSTGISIPTPSYLWNTPIVQYDGSTIMAHEVTLYNLESDGKKDIEDQYTPFNKVLSSDYALLSVIQGIVTAIAPASTNSVPQPQGTLNDSFWSAVFQWFNNIFGDNSIHVGNKQEYN